MAHLQLVYGDVKGKAYRLETLLRGLGYSSLTFEGEGDGICNEWGNLGNLIGRIMTSNMFCLTKRVR